MRRISAIIGTLVLTLSASLVIAAPANAWGGSCAGYQSRTVNPVGHPFVGHSVKVSARICNDLPTGAYGPPGHVRGVHNFVVSFPSTFPASGGEVVSLATRPYYYGSTPTAKRFRFTVSQGVAYLPLRQTFEFELQYRASLTGRMCMVRPTDGALTACTAWK